MSNPQPKNLDRSTSRLGPVRYELLGNWIFLVYADKIRCAASRSNMTSHQPVSDPSHRRFHATTIATRLSGRKIRDCIL